MKSVSSVCHLNSHFFARKSTHFCLQSSCKHRAEGVRRQEGRAALWHVRDTCRAGIRRKVNKIDRDENGKRCFARGKTSRSRSLSVAPGRAIRVAARWARAESNVWPRNLGCGSSGNEPRVRPGRQAEQPSHGAGRCFRRHGDDGA